MAIRNLLVILSLCILSQYSLFAQSNYTLVNNATAIAGCHCYQLTPDQGNQGGGVYQNNSINLNNSFDYTFSVFLGCNGSSGADGMTFILTNNITAIGAQGGGLGYSGLPGNSLAIEYDTYQNGWDPNNHHIAIEYGGQVDHPNGTVAGPINALPSGALIDDCAWHTTEIIWNAVAQTYTVYFDGNLRLTYTGNIIANFFANNPVVNWGWSGSTGGAENTQQVCFNSTANFSGGTNYQSCNPTVPFTDISTSAVATVQSWAWTFGDPGSGAANTSNLQNPSHTFSTTGTYNVRLIITDISGCEDTSTHVVTIAPNITIAPTLTDPTCNGGNNGQISVAATNGFGASAGLGGYHYTWSNGLTGYTGANLDVGLTAGTYNVTVSDGVCSASATYNLTQPSPLSASTSSTDAPCGGTGTATITITGGTPPYTGVTWDGIAATPGPSTYTATGLPVGTVIANFHDANGCSALLQYSAVISQLPCGYTESTSSTNVTCFGGSNGSVSLTVTGTVGTATITWKNSSGTTVGTTATVTGLPAGTYTYTFVDQHPTTLTGTVVVTQPGGAMVVSLSTISTTCSYLNNGSAVASVTANGTPNYSYTWSAAGQPNSPTATGLSPGSITVTVTDQNTCTGTATGTISGQTPLALTVNALPDSCYQTNTGKISVNVTGGTPNYTYLWSSGPTAIGDTVYRLAAGSYTVTVTDHNSCTSTATGTITQPTQLTANIVDSNIACFGGASGTATVSAAGGNGGYSYAWSSGPTTTGITGLAPNTYYVTVTDAKLCTVIDSAKITQPAAAFAVTVDSTNVKCFGASTGSITLVLSGGSVPYGTVNWSGGATGTSRTNLPAGTYSYTVMDAHHCSLSGSVTLTQPSSAFAVAVSQVNVLCNGSSTGSITLTPSGGTLPYATAQWLDGFVGDVRNNLAAGTYSYGDSDNNGCLVTGTVTITQPAAAFNVTSTQTNVLCYGNSTGSINLALGGGTTPYQTVTWRDGGVTGLTRNSLAAGNYSYIATDANGCIDSATITITQPAAAFAVTVDSSNVKCFGTSTGTITLTPSGGTTPYGAVTWTGGASGLNPTGLAAGSYTYTIADANGCTQTRTVHITQPASAFAVAVSQVNVLCNGSSTGSITLTPSGGTTPYATAQWLDGFIGDVRNNLAAGTYSYGDSDNNGCLVTGTVTITQPAAAFNVTSTQTNVLCYGNSTGSINLTLGGGTTPYQTVTWRDGGVTGLTRSGLAAGNYSYIAKDANGCVDSATITITQPASAFTVAVDSTNVKCFGTSTGTITLTPSGGTTPYGAVTWTGGASGLNPTGLAAGNYTYTIADANGCTQTRTINITQPASAFAVAVSQVNVSCNGSSTGSITLTPSGGTTPYATAQWLDGFIGDVRNNLAAGTYSYGDSDNNGCLVTGTVTITQPATAFNVTSTQTNVLCYGNSTGSINLALGGGTTPYQTVTWRDGGVTGLTRNSLAAGNYSYIATDANGCIDSATITITQPAAAFAVTVDSSNVKCFGTSTGTITLTPSGGTTPYGAVTWTGGASGLNPTGLAAGSYTYTIADANGCSQTGTINLTQPASAFNVTFTQVNVLCNGSSTGSIILTPSGGTTPYATAEWLDGFVGDVRNNLAAGTYSYADSDNNGCIVTGSVTITQPASPFTVSATQTNVTCYGNGNGTISLALGGGTPAYQTVTWRDGGVTGTNRTNLAAGNYSYIATDANGCIDSATITITQPAPIVPAISSLSNITCFGANDGTVVVTATGGFGALTYDLDAAGNPQSTGAFSNLTPGAHTVTVQDGNTCDSTISFNIIEPTLVSPSIVSVENASCFGQCNGVIVVSATGGTPPYQYSIDAVTYSLVDSFTGLCANPSYTINVQDMNQCPGNIPASITQPTQVVVAPIDSFPPSCYDGNNASFDVIATGGSGAGYTYSVNGGTFQSGGHFANVTPGIDTVTAQDGTGCTGTYIITVPNVTATSSFTTTAVNETCFGGSDAYIFVTVTGTSIPYTYIWSPGSATTDTLSNIPVGTYTVEVKDANGCNVYGTDSTRTITQPGQMTASDIMTPVTCFGDSNGSIAVTPSGGTQPFSSSWSNGETTSTATALKAGSYTDTIRDANGCQYIDTPITVTQPTPVAVNVDSTTLVSCAGDNNGAIAITATGGTPGYTYLWSQGGNTDPLTGLAVGTYYVTVTDSHGCTAIDSANVGINNPIVLNPTKTNVLCTPLQNGSISLAVTGGAPGYQYLWSNGQTTSSVVNLPVGIDSVTVTDSRGCTADTGFVITNDSAFAITSVPDTATINQGDMVPLAIKIPNSPYSVGNASYTWTPSAGLSCSDCQSTDAAPFSTTQYVITATTDSGCVSSTSILITVVPQHQFYVPNAFTPNNDGVNDFWEAFGDKKAWIYCNVQVFDRWGENVFESSDINFSWDGKYKGNYVTPGEYVYVFKVVFVDDYSVTNKGTITVIR